MKTFNRSLVGAGLFAVATASQAAVDVTAVVAEITGASAPIALIGAGVLVLMVGIKVYKYVRGAL